jgi:hypothetical protein
MFGSPSVPPQGVVVAVYRADRTLRNDFPAQLCCRGKLRAEFFNSTFAQQSSATLGDDDVTQA